jgi:flagellar hook assembly protein FlgD
LKEKSIVKIDIYDKAGRLLKNFTNQEHTPGYYSIEWNGTDNTGRKLPAGIYFIRFEAERYKDTRKIILLK